MMKIIKNSRFKRSALIILALVIVFTTGSLYCEPAYAEIGAQTEVHMGRTLKVGLKYGSSAGTQYNLSCDGGFCVVNMSSDGYMPIVQTITATSVKVIASEGVVNVLDASTEDVLLAGMTQQNLILPLFYSEGYAMAIDGTTYRGGMAYHMNSNGSMNLINVINLEQYLYGVLPAEIGSTSPFETTKAQAVAARSFAACGLEKGCGHASDGFDLCATSHCQVYRGFSSEKTSCTQAVDETAGQCIYYDGEPVMAYYAKNSGGYTQDVSDVWGSKLGYLKAVPDPFCPAYFWEKTYSFSELESMLNSAGKGVGTLQSVEITERSDNYNVKAVTFRGTSGTTTIKTSGIRSFFGSSAVKSNMFAFDGEIKYVDVDASGRTTNGGNTENSTGSDTTLTGVQVISAGGKVSNVNDNSVYVTDRNGQPTKLSVSQITVMGAGGRTETISAKETSSSKTSSKTSKSTGVNSDGTVTITRVIGSDVADSGTLHIVGLGYGHGIGLMQDGAIAMGQAGYSYKEILKYYYTDIEIKNY